MATTDAQASVRAALCADFELAVVAEFPALVGWH
jgi:hypothetical protein